MRRILGGLVFLCALALLTRAADASITRNNQWTTGGHSTSCATGCTFSVTVAPVAGSVEVMTVYEYNSAAAPSGATFGSGTWTSFNSTLAIKQNTFVAWHVAQSGETSYTFTPTVASGTTYVGIVVAEYTNVNTSAPFDVAPSFANPTATTTITGPALTTLQANDMAIYGFGNGSQAETGMTAGWGVVNGGNSANVFETLADLLQGSAGAVSPPAINYAAAPSNPQTFSAALAPAPAVTGGASSLPIAWAGGPHTSQSIPTPTPAPANTPPPPQTYVYFSAFGENLTTTPTQVTDYLNSFCEGQETTPQGASIFNCGAGQTQYWSLNMGQPNLSGHDTSMPFVAGETGTGCPEPSGSNFWASTVPGFSDPNVSTNWGVWPNGTTPGTFVVGGSDMAGAVYPAGSSSTTFNTYLPFLNMASSTMLSYGNSVFQHCGDHDSWSFAREDNATFGNQSLAFTPWGDHNPPAYQQLKNFGGSVGGPPYVSFACNGGGHLAFNGTRCTRSTLISASDTTNLTYPNDAALKAAYCTAFNSFFHKNGKPLNFMINNAFSTDSSVMSCAHVFATQAEKYIVTGCTSTSTIYGTGNNIGNPCLAGLFGHTTSFSADNVATIINWCAATVADNPGKQNMVEDFAGTTQGSALSQWNYRAHYGAIWSCENDAFPNMMISKSYFGNNVSGDIEVYSADFVEPFGRITAYPRKPTSSGGAAPCAANGFASEMGTGNLCSVNGINDPNICKNAAGTGNGSGNSCVVVTEFSHTYFQATPNLVNWPSSPVYGGTNTVTDLGKSCLIDNNTASGIQVTSTTIAAWCPNTSTSLTKVAAWCTPSGYFNTSGSGTIYNMPSSGTGSVCSGSSAASVNQGGAFDHSTLLSTILNEFLPPGDVLFLTAT